MTPQISPVERLKDARVQCTVTFATEEVSAAEETALEKLKQRISLPGFRPGKIPSAMAREHLKEEDILEETIRALAPGVMKDVLTKEKIAPIVQPKIELQSRDPLSLRITFVEHPVVSIDATKLRIPRTPPKVDQKDVDRMVGSVLEQHKRVTPIDRAAADGDQVTMDCSGKDTEGKDIAGTAMKGYQARLGSKTLIPGFEDALKGLKKGDAKTFALNFPEKYHSEDLQGKPVTFAVTVTDVHAVSVPALTDSFAKETLHADSAEAFRARVRDSMIAQEERIDRSRREQALFEAIEKATTVNLAPELQGSEKEHLLNDIAIHLSEQKLSFQDYLRNIGQTPEQFSKELGTQAAKRLRLRFGIEQLIADRGIDRTLEWKEQVGKLIEMLLAAV